MKRLILAFLLLPGCSVSYEQNEYSEGKKFYEACNFKEAVRLLNIYRGNPECNQLKRDKYVLFMLGYSYEQIWLTEDELDREIFREAAISNYLNYLSIGEGEIYRTRSYEGLCRLEQEHDYRAACNWVNKGIAEFPKSSSLYKRAGYLLIYGKKYGKAIVAFKKSVSLNSSDTWAHVGLAQAYEYAGRHQDAIDEYDAALLFDPGNVDAKNSLRWIKGHMPKKRKK